VKAIIKALLRSFGIIAMKRSSRVYLPEDESYRIAVEQCGEAAPVIIDGGAHKGSTVEAFRAVAPRAEFHCFEPDATLAADLLAKFAGDRDVHVVAAALGEKLGTAVFNINVSRPTNSLLPAAEGLQSDLQGLCQTVEKVEVTVTSIDEYCAQQRLDRIDIVKLDLQGYDYHALVGASKAMQGASVVLVEVLFTEIYQGCRLFPDILRLMGEYGFRLFTLSGIHYGSHDELLWADAIFVRDQQRRGAAVSAA
jgi:FkbM family methyltransferase